MPTGARARRAEPARIVVWDTLGPGGRGTARAPDVFPGVRFPSRHFLRGLTLVSGSPEAKTMPPSCKPY
ncbi:hypothetical protein SEVIR_9G492275v4 [Setaria viridis]